MVLSLHHSRNRVDIKVCPLQASLVSSDPKANNFALLLAFSSVISFAYTATIDSDSFTIPSYRGKDLYWFANFDVGDAKNVSLEIDSASTDLLMDPGIYKPSNHAKPYKGDKNFNTAFDGVNRAGFGFETLNGTTVVDTVSAGGLTVTNQTMGRITTYKYFDVPQLPFALNGDGLIGFGAPFDSAFKPQANSWFYNLCDNKSISQRKFAFLFGTIGKGLTVVGKRAKEYIKGELTTTENSDNSFLVLGDVTVDNKIILKSQTLLMDIGTNNIQAPLPEARSIFKKLGYDTYESSGSYGGGKTVTLLKALFSCNQPPTIGFSFPAQADLKTGQTAKNFNVPPEVWDVYNHGNNNCTSILGGSKDSGSASNNTLPTGPPVWLLGGPSFASHYVEFDIDAKTFGFGDLKDPSMADLA